MTTTALADNIAKVRTRIRIAAWSCERHPNSISLLAVSKTRSTQDIRLAAASGVTDIGENYLQEALEKIEQLGDLNLCWHFIGPLQSNKTRAVAENFSWVHSVDRLKIARRLNDQRPPRLPPLQVCLQVNINQEARKSGLCLDELSGVVDSIAQMPKLRLRGLMAIPQVSDDPLQQRQNFAALHNALTELNDQQAALDTLSMGMSGDLEAAIAEGATIVRIGTDIFGPR